MKCITIFSMIVLLSVSAFAASELTFNSSGKPTSLVLGGVSFLDSSNGGIVVTDRGSKRTPQSVVTNGNTVVVTANGGSPVFTLHIDSYDNHVAIHLMDAQGIGTGVDYSLSITIDSDDNAAYTLNDLMKASVGNQTELTWPYIWSRPREDGSRGSVVLYNNTLSGSELDAVLAEIWSTQGTAGHMVRPAVASWTEADVLDWVDRWVEKFKVIAVMSIDAKSTEDLYEMTDYAIAMGATRIYMATASWSSAYYTTVRRDIFPNGNSDLAAYSDHLASNGIHLQLKNMTPQVSKSNRQYINSTLVDDRLMAWSSGTLEQDISRSSTTIKFRGSIDLSYDDESDVSNYFRLENELITFGSISSRNDAVWVLTGCTRGVEGTTAQAHSVGADMEGLVTVWSNFNYQEDFGLPNSLGEEICGEYGEFLNEVKASHIHFDGTGYNSPPWYMRDYTDYVYSKMSQPTTGSTVGRGGLKAHFEMMFSEAEPISGMLTYWILPIRPRLHQTGRKHIETATSKYDIHFDISNGITRNSRRLFFSGGFSGGKLNSSLLEDYGLTDYCLELFRYWREVAPVFTDADQAYVSGFMTKRGSNYSGQDVIVLSKDDRGEYIFTPHRVMGRTSGEDEVIYMDQEWGAVARWQEITTGTRMELENPYETQELQAMIWVQENSAALKDPLITVNGAGTLSVHGTIEPMEYMHFEGGNTVQVYDKDWTLLRSLPATATNFTANKGTLTVTTATGGAGRGGETTDLKVQYVTLGPVYVLEANDFLNEYKNVALYGTATQSSLDNGGDPARAIDGDSHGVWSDGSVTHTDPTLPPHWWQVDLGAPYHIDEIQIYGRTDSCCQADLSDYDVKILNCNGDVVWTNYQFSYPDPFVFLDTEGTFGRYVMIELRGSTDPLSLAEVRVLSDSPARYCGDLTWDGKVDLKDVAELSGGWLFQPGYTMADLLHIGEEWLSGVNPFLLSFDGVNDYVDIAGYPGITGSAARTCAAWIKTTAGGDILGWGNNLGTGTQWCFRVLSSGHLAVQVGGDVQTASAIVNDGRWHHVAVVLPDTPAPVVNDLELYIDGVRITDVTSSSSTEFLNTGGDHWVTIGVSDYLGAGSHYFEGQLDDIRIYNRALSGVEIGSIAHFQDGLVAYWAFHEGSGNIAQDFVSGYDGIIYGADWLTMSEYHLTVNNGSGSGDYMPGTVALISADVAPNGYEFDRWIGDVIDVADVGDPTTTVTMRAEYVDLTATYQEEVLEMDMVWQPAVAISSVSDVSTEGTLVEARNLRLSGCPAVANPIVNGVPFVSDQYDTMPDGTSGSSTDFYPAGTLGNPYDAILSSAGYDTNPIVLGHDLLEIGTLYRIQVWYVDQRSGKEGRRMAFNDGKGNVSNAINGHFVTGTFRADGTTLTLSIVGTGSSAHLNAYQIRKLRSE
ncbi:LamG-like jellyroll fold domain-containing protein [Planctomycetota bacterium]